MAEEQAAGSAGEMMVFGLIEQADRIGKSAQSTQRALAEQIEGLGELQEWTAGAAEELQKRAEAAIKSLEAERVQWQNARVSLERNAAQAIQNAIRQQSAEIERQTVQSMAAPLRDIGQAAAQVRQNVKETSWWMIALMVTVGTVLGLAVSWLPLRSSINNLQEQGNRIEQYLAAQQQTSPVAPSQVPAHKGKK
jgi:hypothetical protein